MTPKDHQKGHGDTKAGFSLLFNTNFKGKSTWKRPPRKPRKCVKCRLNLSETLETQNSLWNRSESVKNQMQRQALELRKTLYLSSLLWKIAFLPQFCTPMCTLTAVSRTQFLTIAIKSLKNHRKYAQRAQGTQNRPRRRKRYRTAVKVPSASALCTRVRATVVFSNLISKKRFSFEHVCKLSRFLGRLLTFSWVL